MRFSDGTQVTLTGLDEIFAELHAEGRKADRKTTEEIITRLEARHNHIPVGYTARNEYAYALLKAYEESPGGQTGT